VALDGLAQPRQGFGRTPHGTQQASKARQGLDHWVASQGVHKLAGFHPAACEDKGLGTGEADARVVREESGRQLDLREGRVGPANLLVEGSEIQVRGRVAAVGLDGASVRVQGAGELPGGGIGRAEIRDVRCGRSAAARAAEVHEGLGHSPGLVRQGAEQVVGFGQVWVVLDGSLEEAVRLGILSCFVRLLSLAKQALRLGLSLGADRQGAAGQQ
jgi:hypothetical protein